MKKSRSRCVALSLVMALAMVASAAAVATAEEPAGNKTRLDAAPPKPGADGWYDASPIDDSFVVRIPGVYQAFSEDGQTETGAPTRTVGVRANVTAAFGGVTSYVASCIRHKGDARTPEQRLQSVLDRWDDRGMVRFRRPIASGPVPGFEFEIADDVKVIRSRIYAPKVGTCTVLMSWRPYAKPSDADIEKYLDSFQLTKR